MKTLIGCIGLRGHNVDAINRRRRQTKSVRMLFLIAAVVAACAPAPIAVPTIVPSGTSPSALPRGGASTPPTASATPRQASPSLRPCVEGDIAAQFVRWGAAAGSYGGSFRIQAVADDCAVPARPEARVLDEGGAELPVLHERAADDSWMPVRGTVGTGATFVSVLWSNHGGEPAYECARRSAPATALVLDFAMTRITLAFPVDRRPVLCASPPEHIFVEVIAR